MIVSVTKNKITIDKGHTANQGEYNIRDCNFLFSEEYTQELVKVAVFSKDGKAYKVDIINNQCIIPIEVLETEGTITVGVYAYSVIEEDGEEILEKRYSPAPAQIFMDYGSYIEDAENASHPTPTEIEQLSARISAVEIDAEQVEINTQNISDLQTNKADKTELPTKTSDLTNDDGFIDNSVNNLINYTLTTQTGSKIDLEINSSTYELTAKLYDKNNNLISTSTGIDLPIESMIVNVSYNDSTKKLTFTLQNGTTIDVDISDIVSGLVSFTDYATGSKAGVVKTDSSYGILTPSATGLLQCYNYNYNEYSSKDNRTFISKGTLENVITGKDLTTKSYVDGLVGDISSALDAINGEVV